jgi:methionyl-tRNA synthetase
MAQRNTYYITTPIYYASGDLHIGHSYTTLAADAISRYKRLRGYDVFFLTGTDEHGLKIQRQAQSFGMAPKAYVDMIVGRIKELWRTLEISYDGFIRTTDRPHEETVQWIFRKLYDNDDIYKKAYESWYCVGCESFYTETQARSFPNMTCPDHGKPLERVKEESYFLRLSKYQDALLQHIQEHPDFIQPVSRRNEVTQFVKSGLEDLCVSRTSFDWGIKLPFDPDSVAYVWIDALANYISAIGYPHDADNFQRWWPADLHLMGKEILRFHAVVWPILLMALDLPLPRQIFAHGWLNLGGKKMSKTMGNVVDPFELCRKYGLDAVRYFALREVPFGADGDYSEESLVARLNSDLANDLGNLVHRTLTMVKKFCGSKVPSPTHENEVDIRFKEKCLSLKEQVEREIDALHLSAALEAIMDVVKAANKYIDDVSPWDLSKNSDPRLGTSLNALCECLRIVALLLRPFMVRTPELIWKALGMAGEVQSQSWDTAGEWGMTVPGQVTRRGKPMFPRIEDHNEDHNDEETTQEASREIAQVPTPETTTRDGSQRPSRPGGPVGVITIDDFRRVQIRVAEVISCSMIKGADKLLKLEIDLGEETRQIVAGIAQYYTPEELVGKLIAVVYNLEPAVIRGVESNGMLLAAKDDNGLALVTVDRRIAPGSRIS